MNKNIKLLGFLLTVSLFFQQCNIINPAETVPTYVHIDSFHVTNGESANITAVTAYYNSNPIGTFDLPATFPVLVTDSGQLQLAPVIAVNGQNGLVVSYPFYTFYQAGITAHPGKVVNYIPQTNYFPNAKIQKIAYFNSGIVDFVQRGGNVPMVTTNADSLIIAAGEWSGAIFLNNVGDSSVDSSIASFTIPSGEAFIEFDYNTTVPFYVGLQPFLSNGYSDIPYYLVGVKPNGKWQKFYVTVQGYASQIQGNYYHLYIKAVLGDNQSSGRLLIDNIKLVTF